MLRQLTEFGFLEANRKRLNGFRAQSGHHTHNRTTVESPAEKSADRNIGDEMCGHALLQSRIDPLLPVRYGTLVFMIE